MEGLRKGCLAHPQNFGAVEGSFFHCNATSRIRGISNQLKRVLKKVGCNAFFRSGQKLQGILYGKNKTRPDSMIMKGVDKFDCQCDKNAIYIGETACSFETHAKEHQHAAETGKWMQSGITQHKQDCDLSIDWSNHEILARFSVKDKGRLKYDLKVQEALFIRKLSCGPNCGLNEN
jgi:hypothetical protein